MKTRRYHKRYGMLILEAVCALSILGVTAIPLAWGVQLEQKKIRQVYRRAVVMELIDGELEFLHAGAYRTFETGVSAPYRVRGEAAKRLPPGEFTLRIEPKEIVLTWMSADGRSQWRGSVANPEAAGGKP